MFVFLKSFLTCLVSFPKYVNVAHLFCRLSFSRFVLPMLNLFKIDVSNILLRMIFFTVFVSVFSCNRDRRCLFYL